MHVTEMLSLRKGAGGVKVVGNMFLVQKFPTESAGDVKEFLEGLVREIYRTRPDWLHYELRETYEFRGAQFIRMDCVAGSVHAALDLRASTKGGITRDILQLGTRSGRAYAWLVHGGQASEHSPDEVKRIN